MAYGFHKGKLIRDPEITVYYNEFELPETSSRASYWGWGKIVPHRNYFVALLKDKQGGIWVWERDVEDCGFWHTLANFVDGRQIDGINPRIQVLPEDKAEKLGRRNGAAHFLGNEIKECRSRFNPVVWKGYEKEGLGAIVEYFDIQVNQHSKHNSVIKNLFVEPFERGTWLPLLAVVITAGALITFFLPAILLAVTKLFSRLLFRKEGKARENTSAVMAGSGKRGDVNETFKGLKDIDVRIRQRLMVIIPTLNSIGRLWNIWPGFMWKADFCWRMIRQKKEQ